MKKGEKKGIYEFTIGRDSYGFVRLNDANAHFKKVFGINPHLKVEDFKNTRSSTNAKFMIKVEHKKF